MIVMRGYRRSRMILLTLAWQWHHKPPVACLLFLLLETAVYKTTSSCSLIRTTKSDGSRYSAFHCKCVQTQIERFAILEYSQHESDSGEAYNLHCYLWQDSKAAMRGDPRTLWGLSSSIWPRLDQHMEGQRHFDHRHPHTETHTSTQSEKKKMFAASLLLCSSF